MTEPLTLDWIISTLKKSGINSKQVVIDRLEKASYEDLVNFNNSIMILAIKKSYDLPEVKHLKLKAFKEMFGVEENSKLDPRD